MFLCIPKCPKNYERINRFFCLSTKAYSQPSFKTKRACEVYLAKAAKKEQSIDDSFLNTCIEQNFMEGFTLPCKDTNFEQFGPICYPPCSDGMEDKGNGLCLKDSVRVTSGVKTVNAAMIEEMLSASTL